MPVAIVSEIAPQPVPAHSERHCQACSQFGCVHSWAWENPLNFGLKKSFMNRLRPSLSEASRAINMTDTAPRFVFGCAPVR